MFNSERLQFYIVFIVAVSGKNAYCQQTLPQDPAEQNTTQGPYYTGDKIPGDPNNGIKILQRVYKFIRVYRVRHQGSYQTVRGMVTHDILNNPQAYGFHSMDEAIAAFSNPDAQYDDLSYIRQDPLHKGGPALLASRLDGTPLGGPKPSGTVDILAQINTYLHRNLGNTDLGRTWTNPTGFYLVLQDDGSTKKIPYDEAFFVCEVSSTDVNEITITPAFPRQAGVPYNSLSYEEYWAVLPRPKRPPIGYPIATGKKEPIPDNGAFESLLALSRLRANEIERELIWDTLGRGKRQFTLADVVQGSAKLGLPLQQKKLSLSELQKLNAPAILYLSDASRLVTLADLDDKQAIVLDQGMTRIVSLEVLAKRYGGEALLSASATTASQVLIDDPIRVLSLKSRDDKVKQQVKITNNGKKPLNLQIERPIPGVTEADLSNETVAPGQSVMLSLSIKWRSVLKGDTQNVFVFLRTNDPVRPRIQLGFQLNPPKDKAAPTEPATAPSPAAQSPAP